MSHKEIDVAVAIIRDGHGRILVNQRQADKEHAGLWEFPGGKFNDNEDVSTALRRECMEELGIDVIAHVALIELTHEYPNKKVRLHVHEVTSYLNQPRSLEGQELAWTNLADLEKINLLPADKPILFALAK